MYPTMTISATENPKTCEKCKLYMKINMINCEDKKRRLNINKQIY